MRSASAASNSSPVSSQRIALAQPHSRGKRSVAPPDLAAAAAALAALFAAHLALEERAIFPAIAALPAEVQATIRAEMLARRR